MEKTAGLQSFWLCFKLSFHFANFLENRTMGTSPYCPAFGHKKGICPPKDRRLNVKKGCGGCILCPALLHCDVRRLHQKSIRTYTRRIQPKNEKVDTVTAVGAIEKEGLPSEIVKEEKVQRQAAINCGRC